MATAAALVTALTAGASVPPAEPNRGTARLAKTPAGPYLLSVWTQPEPPRVGRLDVSVAVIRPTTEEAILDAERVGQPERACKAAAGLGA